MRDIEKYTEDYIKNWRGFESTMIVYRYKNIISNVITTDNDSILEIGCGIDPLFDYFNAFNPIRWKTWDVIEPGEAFIKQAETHVKHHKNVTIHQGFIEDLAPSFNKKFDVIFLSSLLHEVEKPAELIKAVKSLCHKDTVVYINVSNADSMHNQLAVTMGIKQYRSEHSDLAKLMQRNISFNLDSLCYFMEKNGFEIVDKGGYFLKLFTYYQLEQMMEHNILDKAMLDGLYYLGVQQPEQAAEIYVNVKLKA